MSRLFYHVMQDNAGNLLFGVSGTMRLAGSGTLATIYGDEALTVILPNPMTNHASFGSFKCFLGAGDYDFYMAKSGYTFETLTGVQGHGTMAQQDASAVAITGGIAILHTLDVNGIAEAQRFTVPDSPGNDQIAFQSGLNVGGTNRFAIQCYGNAPSYLGGLLEVLGKVTGGSLFVADSVGNDQFGFQTALNAAGGTNRYAIQCYGTAPSYLGGTLQVQGNVGLGLAPSAAVYRCSLLYDRATMWGLAIQPSADTGGGGAVFLLNAAGTAVGSITTTAAATAYNTTSDARLKHDVDDLTGELALVQALRPVGFKWNVDGSPGVGFLAHEVAGHVQGVITGEQDAVDDAGGIIPQQIDYSKLVPYLVGAIKTLAARVAVLEDAAGI